MENTNNQADKSNLKFTIYNLIFTMTTSTQISDISANIIHHIEYMPFGETFVEQRSNWGTNYKFNGKELDEETGFYYYGARYYNPDISIWLSIDPLSDKYPSLSPYNYCANNPIKYVDPDGMRIDDPLKSKYSDPVKNPRIASSGSSGRSGGRFGEGVRNGGRSSHWGTDIYASKGTEITPIAAGEIISQGSGRGWGNYVMIKSELTEGQFLFTVYAHVSSDFKKKIGDNVDIDDVIAIQGNTGNAADGQRTGEEHVHIETRIGNTWANGEKKNPENFMKTKFDKNGEPRKVDNTWRTDKEVKNQY